jgi:hypothetical protein
MPAKTPVPLAPFLRAARCRRAVRGGAEGGVSNYEEIIKESIEKRNKVFLAGNGQTHSKTLSNVTDFSHKNSRSHFIGTVSFFRV